MTNFDIPTGYGFPLVDLSTDLFPSPTMVAMLAYMQSNLNMVQVVTLASQAEYDALTPEQKNDPYTIYTVPV